MNNKAQLIMAKEIPKILFYIVFLVIISFILIFNAGLFSKVKTDGNWVKEIKG